MGVTYLDRRAAIAGLGAFAPAPQIVRAEDVIDLKWTDLVPEGQPAIPRQFRGLSSTTKPA